MRSYHSPHGGMESRERIRSYEFHYPGNESNGLYKFNVLLTTYNILMADLEVLQDIHWKYMIVDEAQRAKSQHEAVLRAEADQDRRQAAADGHAAASGCGARC